jgi:uncharacterized protein
LQFRFSTTREDFSCNVGRHTLAGIVTNVIDLKRNQVATLCQRTGAVRLDAFGSAVRGDFDPASSDLDFIVEFEDVPPAAYAQAYFSLKEGLEALFRRPVDLVTGSGLENPFFRDRVASERRTVYAR